MAAVITGARARIKLSGDVIAFASGISVTHEQRLEEIPQLDNLEIAEYAESGHRVSVSVSFIKLASDAKIAGQSLSNNAADFSMDSLSDPKSILLQPELIIEVVDAVPVRNGNGQITGYNEVPIYTAFGCKFEGGTGQLSARGIWEGNWNFKGRRGFGI
jgi:hypothetical protein